jgi:ATP-dependent DNA ligase
VIAKRLGDPYTRDKRTLIKVKHQRTADCVIAGYRIHKDGNGVGSLLLGLYDDQGDLHHVGVVASFTVKRRAELLAELEPLTHDALENHPWRDWAEWSTRADESGTRMPGAGSRWNAGKDLSWVPLRIERVAEVTFGQLQEGRFRHGSQFLRWRPDREPASCRYDQLEVASPVAFASVVGRQ